MQDLVNIVILHPDEIDYFSCYKSRDKSRLDK